MQMINSEIQKKYTTAKELQVMLDVSEYRAYKICRELNKELEAKGFIILKGKIPTRYLIERLGIS